MPCLAAISRKPDDPARVGFPLSTCASTTSVMNASNLRSVMEADLSLEVTRLVRQAFHPGVYQIGEV